MRLTKSNVGLKTVQNLTKTDIKMKNVILFALFFSIGKTASSQVFLAKDKSAQISFFSETPMENIDAKSDAVTSIYNSSNDSIIVKVQITTFVFPKSLMYKRHYNDMHNIFKCDSYINNMRSNYKFVDDYNINSFIRLNETDNYINTK